MGNPPTAPRDPNASGENLLRCPSCHKGYRVHPEQLPAGVDSFNCRRCGSLVSLRTPAAGPGTAEPARSILVVVQEDELAQLVLRVLGRNSMGGTVAQSGSKAMALAAKMGHAAALVSVVLPDMMGYELIDRFKKELAKPFPTILLSTIHHAARYKRAPTSLYGADDHLERHHLPDMLVPKIQRLLDFAEGGQGTAVPTAPAAHRDEDVHDHRELERMHRGEAQVRTDPLGEEVLRMCRIIAADIVLYNGNLIGGSPPGEVMTALGGDLREGEKLLRSRFPDFEGDPARMLADEMGRVLASRGVAVVGRDQ